MFFQRNKNSRPHNWLIHHICISSVQQVLPYIKGRVLDVGCGEKPYLELIKPVADVYLGMDRPLAGRFPLGADIAGDAANLPVLSSSLNTVVSFQVMEHIANPQEFMNEIFRVLVPGGHAVITTPFMWAEHEQPYDYFRYTRYGLEKLASDAGFEVIMIQADTGTMTSAALRVTYWLNHFRLGPLRPLFYPLYYMIQVTGFLLDKLSPDHLVDTSTFTTVLKKP